MSTELLKRLLVERKIYRSGELRAAGVETRTIMRAIASGLVERPVVDGTLGPVPGIVSAVSAQASPDRDACIATLLTGGVLSGQYAAMHHGLSTSLEPRLVLTAMKGASVPPEANATLRWTRVADHLVHGVESIETDLGMPLRITGEARTVVDLLRFRGSHPDDYRHGLAALGTFLERGGRIADVMELAGRFGKACAAAVEIACHAADDSLQRGFGA